MFLSRNFIAAFLLLAFAGLGLMSCEHRAKSDVLYPVDSLLTRQVQHLLDYKAVLSKQAVVGNTVDTTTYAPTDSLQWSNELSIFYQLSAINKSGYRSEYVVEDGLFDPRSNLTVKAFYTEQKLPVRYVRVFYKDSAIEPRRIEALYSESNVLSQNSRLLVMQFERMKNENILTAYSVEGGQKMILGDSVTFSIRGRIKID